MKKITIVTDSHPIHRWIKGKIGLLVYCAPDSDICQTYKDVIPMNELIGHPEDTYRMAASLVNKLLMEEPLLRGVPQLTVFQEQVNWEMHKIYRLLHLHDFLLREKFTVCEFIFPSWWGDALSKLVDYLHSPLSVIAPACKKNYKIINSLKRIFSYPPSFKALYSEWKAILDYLDPFHRRTMFFRKKHQAIDKEKLWYYTTAETFTNIGLLYEPFLPDQLCFLVENKLTGGKSLIAKKRHFVSPYRYALPSHVPSRLDVNDAVRVVGNHISHQVLDERETIAHYLFLQSPWLSLFFSRYLPIGLFASALFDHWAQLAKPAALLVGNPVFEGYALHAARHKKIPTLLLQHGLLGGCYLYYDHPVDYYILRGEFWRESLSPISKKRTQVLNDMGKIPHSNLIEKKSIVFITQPLHTGYMPIKMDYEPILLTVLSAVKDLETDLIVRVHPLEKISDYEIYIKQLLKRVGFPIRISYSSGNDLDEVLQKACAVVLVNSTVFLDCIKYSVPIISFDWVDFWFKDRIKQYAVFNFAKNLQDFYELIMAAYRGELWPVRQNADYILANTPSREIKSALAEMLKHKLTAVDEAHELQLES
ncbi:MAG: hypothetical protein ACD_60C00028G0018 [uncultured bacterium]|nr:MAG: hypothetical protein ACD_60C00028G0018 [uncultured bacterium]